MADFFNFLTLLDILTLLFGVVLTFVMYYVFVFLEGSDFIKPLKTIQTALIFFVFRSTFGIVQRANMLTVEPLPGVFLPTILEAIAIVIAIIGLLQMKETLEIYKEQRDIIIRDIIEIGEKYRKLKEGT
ncbi:hypothetical protein HY991_05980 [Candidatus Micrarchaeota archaeon]|nr:hypothetical protein [Candidatus Micrarchaeota archaeon]